jgi:CRP/FNR family transcriptional regulator
MLTYAKTDELRQIHLFRDLTEEELRYLLQKLDERVYRKDDLIYMEGDVPNLLYIIPQGAVEITKKTPTGHRQVIAMVLAGRFFGELSFFEKRRHEARARATVDTRLLVLDRFAYDEMERERPGLVHHLLHEIVLVMSANLDVMNEMFLEMIHYIFYGRRAGAIEPPGNSFH